MEEYQFKTIMVPERSIKTQPKQDDLSMQLRRMMRRLEEITQCQVCLADMGKDVIQCAFGHVVCATCRPRLKCCPTCKEQFLHHKPTLLCQLLEVLPRLCQYNSSGCQSISLGENHQECCEFRTVKCRVIKNLNQTCSWSGLARDLKSHVNNHHNSLFATYGTNTSKKFYYKHFKANSWVSQCYYHLVDNNLFLLFIKKDRRQNKLIQIVKHIPINSIGQNYCFSLTFAKIGQTDFTIKQPVRAKPLLDENEKLAESQFSMITPMEDLDRFVNSSGSLEVIIHVLKV